MSATTAMENQSRQQDISDLIKAIHEDRLAAKQKEKRESWTKYVSLMVVALAVVTAYGSLKAGGYSSRVLLNQALLSDTWAYFQAKSIKRSLAEMESRLGAPEAQAEARKRADKYQGEQEEIQREAKRYETNRDQAAKHGPPLGSAIAALQIAIALASVCMITKRKSLWAASAALGLVGVLYLVYGLFLI